MIKCIKVKKLINLRKIINKDASAASNPILRHPIISSYCLFINKLRRLAELFFYLTYGMVYGKIKKKDL